MRDVFVCIFVAYTGDAVFVHVIKMRLLQDELVIDEYIFEIICNRLSSIDLQAVSMPPELLNLSRTCRLWLN